MLPALGIDAQLERGTLPAIQQAEAVAQPVVLPRLGRPEADPRCSDEAVSDRASRNRGLRGRPPDAWLLRAVSCVFRGNAIADSDVRRSGIPSQGDR